MAAYSSRQLETPVGWLRVTRASA